MQTLALTMIQGTAIPVPGTDPWYVDPQDSALAVMTDFREHASVTVAARTSIDDALEHMKHTGVRSAFVTDEQSRQVIGLLTAYDISSEKPMQHMLVTGIPRQQLAASDIMAPIADWRVANIEDVELATVSAVASMFAHTGLTHVAVIEAHPSGGQRLRGMLSAAKVRRVLTKPGTPSPARREKSDNTKVYGEI